MKYNNIITIRYNNYYWINVIIKVMQKIICQKIENMAVANFISILHLHCVLK